MTNLKNKTALITGASRGIGAAIATRLAADGAHVILHYGTGEAEARGVAESIKAKGGTAELVQADLSRAEGPKQLAERVKSAKVDILVNNAGVAPFASIAEMDEATFDTLANVNMRSLFFVTQKLLPKIPDGGRIINISSAVAVSVIPRHPRVLGDQRIRRRAHAPARSRTWPATHHSERRCAGRDRHAHERMDSRSGRHGDSCANSSASGHRKA
jgi:NAD(P)-dependent dehydrogenase (short-subunit alcohol dehydrogenase family)